MGCSPWGRKESDTTERLHFHCSLSCTGEGNGTPLQCSCLENPRDGGAWWAAVYGVAQSRTRLERLSSSSAASVSAVRQCESVIIIRVCPLAPPPLPAFTRWAPCAAQPPLTSRPSHASQCTCVGSTFSVHPTLHVFSNFILQPAWDYVPSSPHLTAGEGEEQKSSVACPGSHSS